MSRIDATTLLRPGLLEGVSIVLAGASPSPDDVTAARASFASAARRACAELGAHVHVLAEPAPGGWLEADEDAVGIVVQDALAAAVSVELLVVDVAGMFGSAVEAAAARTALRASLDACWNVTRAVVNDAFLAHARAGRVVYLAPPDGAGEHAGAARAGVENLARTLSIEWARHGITTVAVAVGSDDEHRDGSAVEEAAVVTAYLASPAGAYFSGCVLDLSAPGTATG